MNAPIFPGDEEKSRRAALLNILLWAATEVAALHILIGAIVGRDLVSRLVLAFSIFPALYGLWWLMRRGRVGLASTLFCLALFAFLVTYTAISAEARGLAIDSLIIVVLVAGLLMGFRAAWVFAGLYFCAGVVLWITGRIGYLPGGAFKSDVFTFVVMHVALILAALFVLYLAIKSLEQALARAQKEAAERQRSDEAYRALVDNSLQGLVIVQDNYIVFANPAFIKMSGYTLTELLALSEETVVELVHSEDRSIVVDAYTQSRRENLTSYTCRGKRKDGTTMWIEVFASVIQYREQPAIQFAVIDATEQRHRNEALRRLSCVVEQNPSTVVIATTEGDIVYVNPAFSRVTGYAAHEVRGANPRILQSGVHPPGFYRELWDTVRAGLEWRGEFVNRCKNGEHYWETASISPLRDESGAITHFIKVAEDITARKRVEQALQDSEREYRTTVDAVRDPIHVVDVDLRLVLCNKTLLDQMSRLNLLDDFIGRDLFDVFPFLSPTVRSEYQATIETGDVVSTEETTQVNDQVFITETRKIPILEAGKVVRIVTVMHDVTEREQVMQALRTSLCEKEVLLKEIYHRVNNNMQIINSLLRIQAARISDNGAALMLRESQNRIRSMALVHEKLYHSPNLDRIYVGEYVRSLANHLFGSCEVDVEQIDFHLDIQDDAVFPIDVAIPCGLILTELLSNVLYHAFPPSWLLSQERARVGIALAPVNGKEVLTVRDNGIGLPVDVVFDAADSLGLQLIHMWAEQIDASLEVDRINGTTVRVIFANVG